MGKKNRRFGGMALVLSMLLFLAGCTMQNTPVVKEESSILVNSVIAKNDTLTLTNQFVGTIMPKESVYVIPLAQGSVIDTYFEVGDTVNAGDILFEIDSTAAQLQLQQAELTYNNTKLQLDSSWDSAQTQKDSTIDQLEMQKTTTLSQLQAAQTQYFTLKDTVDTMEDALEDLKKSNDNLNNMSDMEKYALAGSLLIDVDLTTLMPAQVHEMLKAALSSQISELEKTIWQTRMSLATAETGLQAAEEGYDMVLKSLEDAQNMDLTDTKKQLDSNLNLAKLAVDSAKLALSYYSVEAPISGTVITKGVDVNGFATSSQPAYVIANDETMSVTFSVSEAVKNTLNIGAALVVERNGMEFEGSVTEIGNAVNQQTGLFQIKGIVYANGTELPSGVSVKLFAETYKAEDQIIIPYDAVYYESDCAYVYVAKDGKAVKTVVTTGIFNEEKIEITSGLQLEDEIITSWSPRLIDGADVSTKASLDSSN